LNWLEQLDGDSKIERSLDASLIVLGFSDFLQTRLPSAVRAAHFHTIFLACDHHCKVLWDPFSELEMNSKE
jgi:hypothetical protein